VLLRSGGISHGASEGCGHVVLVISVANGGLDTTKLLM
jgi:hypothetical protein